MISWSTDRTPVSWLPSRAVKGRGKCSSAALLRSHAARARAGGRAQRCACRGWRHRRPYRRHDYAEQVGGASWRSAGEWDSCGKWVIWSKAGRAQCIVWEARGGGGAGEFALLDSGGGSTVAGCCDVHDHAQEVGAHPNGGSCSMRASLAAAAAASRPLST
eukprot:2721492-Pleurochrysis_carterae.AAC.1